MMNFEKNNSEISKYMNQILHKYSEIRGKAQLNPDQFWDAVIISASDESQMKGYEKQIAGKQTRKEIPLGIPFHVFADPPGYKIGCGGSAMFVLDKMAQIYENAFQSMRILFIPAGGYSQRLPNLTAMGKLFCPLPFGDVNYQMLDLILATYLPFLQNMPPGVFLASSDAIISYSLSDKDKWTFKNEGFTAVAHPSPIHVGCGHGVYVLPEIQDHSGSSAFISECLRVLQKPSIEEMHDKGAVVNFKSGSDNNEVIFSDSTFFFDFKIVTKLINFYKDNKPLKSELSSYGDFLQPLGSNASPSYIVENENNEELALTRSAIYRNLYGTNLSILVLKNSYFHHLGTMKEYLESFCFKNNFSCVFPICRMSVTSFSVNEIIPLYIEGTVLHSVIHPMSCVPETSIVEYCDINIAVDIGNNCIVSNIQLEGASVERLPYSIPDNCLIHTVAVDCSFVTIACNVNDDIKKTFNFRSQFEANFFGKKLDYKCFAVDCDKVSLWNAKIFPLKETAGESLIETLRIISCDNEDEMKFLYKNLDDEVLEFYSMADILCRKDTEKIIEYQKNLYNKIKLRKELQKA